MLASSIITLVAGLLNDPLHVRWSESALLAYLNEGRRQICVHRPDANTVTATVQLLPGCNQGLPMGGLRLLAVNRNMGAAGALPGPVIRLCDAAILDAIRPRWRAELGKTTIKQYLVDDRLPRQFWVYPPAHATIPVFVELVYAAAPADVATTDAIGLDESYASSITDWMLYRAHATDTDTASASKASLHQQAFYNALGVKLKSDLLVSPKQQEA